MQQNLMEKGETRGEGASLRMDIRCFELFLFWRQAEF